MLLTKKIAIFYRILQLHPNHCSIIPKLRIFVYVSYTKEQLFFICKKEVHAKTNGKTNLYDIMTYKLGGIQYYNIYQGIFFMNNCSKTWFIPEFSATLDHATSCSTQHIILFLRGCRVSFVMFPFVYDIKHRLRSSKPSASHVSTFAWTHCLE